MICQPLPPVLSGLREPRGLLVVTGRAVPGWVFEKGTVKPDNAGVNRSRCEHLSHRVLWTSRLFCDLPECRSTLRTLTQAQLAHSCMAFRTSRHQSRTNQLTLNYEDNMSTCALPTRPFSRFVRVLHEASWRLRIKLFQLLSCVSLCFARFCPCCLCSFSRGLVLVGPSN